MVTKTAFVNICACIRQRRDRSKRMEGKGTIIAIVGSPNRDGRTNQLVQLGNPRLPFPDLSRMYPNCIGRNMLFYRVYPVSIPTARKICGTLCGTPPRLLPGLLKLSKGTRSLSTLRCPARNQRLSCPHRLLPGPAFGILTITFRTRTALSLSHRTQRNFETDRQGN